MNYQHYGEYDAPIAQGAPGTTTVVAGQAGYRTRVIGYVFTISGLGSAKFVSGATDKTGAMTFAENGGLVSRDIPFWCGPGEDLKIVSAGGAANGHLVYQRIPA